MLDQFHPCIHDSIENVIDVKPNGNCVRNHLLKELAKWSMSISTCLVAETDLRN